MRISTEDTGISPEIVETLGRTLAPYRETLERAARDTGYTSPESTLALPFDEALLTRTVEACAAFGHPHALLILVGIGGSDLGARAIMDALPLEQRPRVFLLESVEPPRLALLVSLLAACAKPADVALAVVSKSGSTSETLANAAVAYQRLVERFGAEAARSRTMVVAGEGALLLAQVASMGIQTVSFPTVIGGRYSVFSAAGLVPLVLLGVRVSALHEGARAAIQASLRPQHNPALEIAAALFEHYTRGVRLHDFFAFHSELETLGKWYRQLLAESVGKVRARDQERIGIHASVVIGSTDLHSVGQLIFGGPRNRFATFVTVPSLWSEEPHIPTEGPFTVGALKGKAVGALPRAIFAGTKRAYTGNSLPYASIELADRSERELGAFMGLSMVSVMLLGKLLEVNVFDQPAVELYKQETLAVLETHTHQE